jgi:hypothetical protein
LVFPRSSDLDPETGSSSTTEISLHFERLTLMKGSPA